MAAALALLPSALLGPAVWRPVAEVLAARGREVVELSPLAGSAQGPDDVLAWYLGALPDDRPVVVVAHSNAGLFVPGLTSQRRVDAMVYVDAGVPPASGVYPLTPPGFLTFLEGLADDEGLLPVWTQWWGDHEVDSLFPGPVRRQEVEAEQRRLPLTYFTRSLVAAGGWDARPAAYLAFGATYDEDRAEAVARGWPVSTMTGQHLHMMIDPVGVADQIEDLLAQILP